MAGEEAAVAGPTDVEPDYKALYEQAVADAQAATEEAAKWKALSRKNEARSKDNYAAAQTAYDARERLAAMTERMTALEDENARLRGYADAARWNATVASVSEATGVPKDILGMINATDEAALIEAAEAIAGAYRPPTAPYVPEAGTFAHDLMPQPTDWLRAAFEDAGGSDTHALNLTIG